MHHINAILVDMDGTLADTHPFLYHIYKEILEEYGHTGSQEEFDTWIGPKIEEFLTFLKKKYELPVTVEDLYRTYRKKAATSYAEKTALFENAKTTLEKAVKKGIKVVLVTSAPASMANSFLKHKGIEHLFYGVVTGDMVTQGKPHPEIYLKALSLFSLNKAEVIAIEDSLNGIRAATSAGLPVLQFGPVSYKAFFQGKENVEHCDHWSKIQTYIMEGKP